MTTQDTSRSSQPHDTPDPPGREAVLVGNAAAGILRLFELGWSVCEARRMERDTPILARLSPWTREEILDQAVLRARGAFPEVRFQ